MHDDEPTLYHRHLILCRTIWYTGDLDDGFSLGRLIVHIRPRDGVFPFRSAIRLFLFAQLFGDPGEYTVRIHIRRVTLDEETGEEEVLETDAPAYGPWTIALYGEEYVEGFAFPLNRLPFREPGLYELQLTVDEIDGWYAAERVDVREGPS